MSNYDSDILISNIKSHMSDKGITQEKLADVLGMSQSNVSKALSTNDKKSFTLDQVIGIAKFFHVSVNSLIGEKEYSDLSITPRSIAAFLVKLLEEDNVKMIEELTGVPVLAKIQDGDTRLACDAKLLAECFGNI